MNLRLLLALTALLPSSGQPPCVPFDARSGHWVANAGIAGLRTNPAPLLTWVADDPSAACRYRVDSRETFAACFRNRRVAFVGDSTSRNMVLALAVHMVGCDAESFSLGPAEASDIQFCRSIEESVKAPRGLTFVLPARCGNVTLEYVRVTKLRDFTGPDAATIMHAFAPRTAGGFDAVSISLGLWDIKTEERKIDAFLDALPAFTSLFADVLLPADPTLRKRLVWLTEPYSEPFLKNDVLIPHEQLDMAATAIQRDFAAPLGITYFNTRHFARHADSAEVLRNGGHFVTRDGLHLTASPEMAVLRELLSFWCAALPRELEHTVGVSVVDRNGDVSLSLFVLVSMILYFWTTRRQ